MADTGYTLAREGPEIDEAIERALPGGEIDAALDGKAEIEFLVNVDFTNPVAQAGIGGLHGRVAYAVDRWKLLSGTVSWNSNGLTLNGTIRQIREFQIGFSVVPSIEMHSGTATITYDDSTKYCDITSSGGTIKRPHLGLRGITDWSKLPKPRREQDFLECRKHFKRFSVQQYRPFGCGYTFVTNDALIYATIIYSEMRAIPVVAISADTDFGAAFGGSTAATTSFVTANNFVAKTACNLCFGIATGHGASKPCSLINNSGNAYIDLISDL